ADMPLFRSASSTVTIVLFGLGSSMKRREFITLFGVTVVGPAQHRAVLVSQYDRARAGADRDARASSAVDAINIGRPSDVADRTNKIGRCAAKGKPITPSADRERIAPAMKHQRAASGRAANDKAGLDNVEADAAAGGVGGGGEPGAGHAQSNQHGTNGR